MWLLREPSHSLSLNAWRVDHEGVAEGGLRTICNILNWFLLHQVTWGTLYQDAVWMLRDLLTCPLGIIIPKHLPFPSLEVVVRVHGEEWKWFGNSVALVSKLVVFKWERSPVACLPVSQASRCTCTCCGSQWLISMYSSLDICSSHFLFFI